MTQAQDTTTIDAVSPQNTTVLTIYDSLNRVLEEAQEFDSNDRYITNSAFTSYPVTQFTFPDDRQITHAYDVLYRRILVEETSGGADIATWEFFGPGRVAEVQLENGLICTMMNNTRTHSAVQA